MRHVAGLQAWSNVIAKATKGPYFFFHPDSEVWLVSLLPEFVRTYERMRPVWALLASALGAVKRLKKNRFSPEFLAQEIWDELGPISAEGFLPCPAICML